MTMALLDKLLGLVRVPDTTTRSGKFLAIAGSLGCIGVGYHYLVVKRREHRKAKTGCACGNVVIAIDQPPANYSYMDASCIQCTCDDCVKFCEEVIKQGSSKMTIKDMGQPGITTTVFYDSELKVLQGQEFLESMKHSEGSNNRRIYSKCCGTPIAISDTGAPLNLVYCCNIKPEEEGSKENNVNMTPTCCFHSRKDDVVPAGSKIRMINGMVAPRSILEIITRLFLLVFVGSYGSGTGIPHGNDKTIGIGLDSIEVDNNNNSKK